MTTFHEREQAFEAKFAHDEEFRFLLTVRRDKVFAGWAAERLHLSEPARTHLIASVMAVRNGAGHDELILAFMADTFAAHGRTPTQAEFAASLESCGAQAQRELMASPSDKVVYRSDSD